ncbi:MAG: monovalent cation/H(+) antiporter subunit G [Candidatus Rokubacteria bacterium]|nr:monovalent cation/H(+) antiporter subunit G [Candidatus Rokubacteria bacterium]
MTVLVVLLLAAGLFFHAVAALGVLRLPDFYTRLHAVSKAETLGMLFTLAAIIVWIGPSLTAVKVALVGVFVFMATPTSAHAIGRAALRTGLKPWRRRGGSP